MIWETYTRAITQWLARWLSTRPAVVQSNFVPSRTPEKTRRFDGHDYPESGRSSVESTLAGRISAAISGMSTVSPVIDFTMLTLLKQLWIFNPDFSKHIANVVNLANTGHSIRVEAATDARAEAALARINEAASRLYRNGAGIDGLINAYITQIAWSGALSSEDVVDFAGRRVEKIVIVPVEEIRFRLIDGEYVPHQRPGTALGLQQGGARVLGLVRLNDETYRYYAMQTIENSPYAKPPSTAAVEMITGPQTDILSNIKMVTKKMGLLGIMTMVIKRPPQAANESPEAYYARCRVYQSQVAAATATISATGVLVAFDDQTPTHTNVTADARGAYDINRMVEEQTITGLDDIPAFFGRTDSSTETYANVVYNFSVSKAGNMRRLAKRRQERTYGLDCLLGGVEYDGISMVFNRAHERDPLGAAEAENQRFETARDKAKCGMISPDEAAQDCGYESAFDPDLMIAAPEVANSLQNLVDGGGRRPRTRTAREGHLVARFDVGSQRYRHVREVLTINA